MGKKEAGRFRGQLFGGFRRRDVLEYMGVLYGRIDQADLEKEAMRTRCEELENLLQNLEKFSGQGASTLAGSEFSAPPKETRPLEMDSELVALLHTDPTPEPAEETRTEVEILETAPIVQKEEAAEPEPVVPEPASVFAPTPEPVAEPVPVVPLAEPMAEPQPIPEPIPSPESSAPATKPGRSIPYPTPPGGPNPKRVKVRRK